MGKNFRKSNFGFKTLLQGVGLLFIIVMWAFILFNPVIFTFYYSNPLWLFLYVLIVPEFFVGALVTHIIFEILD